MKAVVIANATPIVSLCMIGRWYSQAVINGFLRDIVE